MHVAGEYWVVKEGVMTGGGKCGLLEGRKSDEKRERT